MFLGVPPNLNEYDDEELDDDPETLLAEVEQFLRDNE